MPGNSQSASSSLQPFIRSRAPYFRTLAAEHELLAARAPTPEQRSAFLKVAASYSELAEHERDQDTNKTNNSQAPETPAN